MLTWWNIWFFIIVLSFAYTFLTAFISELKGRKNVKFVSKIFPSVWGATAISLFVSAIFVGVSLVSSIWYFVGNDADLNGYYIYNDIYLEENIVYSEKYSNGNKVFIDGKEFIFDSVIIDNNIDDYKIMKSTYVWNSWLHKFFFDHIFFEPDVKYQLVIPESYL